MTIKRSIHVVTLTVVLLAALSGAALAKGASGASISGPGMGGPTDISGSGEPGSGDTVGQLAEGAGFWAAFFGDGDTLAEQPAGDLGPRFVIRWQMPGPSGEEFELVQDLYPYATGGPVTYTPPDQLFFDDQRSVGGWYLGGAALAAVLDDVGVPAEPPAAPPAVPLWLPAMILLAVLVAVGGAVVAVSARPAPQPS